MRVNLQKRISGIVVFILSLLTYLMTLEPTTSFWDCSEFIACAYKLEIGHAPGAPVYMLLGRLFSFFALGNTEYVAMAINALSAVASALTVFFLFHIIFWFSSKIMNKNVLDGESQSTQSIAIMAALVGSLSYAFTDSFWFSAVEAEVYATSSLFSALVFWCITKYDLEPKGWPENRWLIFLFFLLGLSVGIHLLNLLALPAIALVIYLKHYQVSIKKSLLAILLSTLLIVFFVYLLIPGIAKSAACFDLFFVNSLKLPVYSGVMTFVLLAATGIMILLRYLTNNKSYLFRFILIVFSFWLLGYSSFTILVIRSTDDPFVDMNNVENIFGLVDYLNREQYGQRPLIYGNNYNSPVTDSKKRFTYKLYNEKYYQDELNPDYVYDENTMTLFPRMASTEARHIDAYKKWVDIEGRSVLVNAADGTKKTIVVPTFFENIQFFLKYQLGHMYVRYFMWNFTGRQNDIQGHGDRFFGNWISGIPIIDNWRLGYQNELPDFFQNQPSKNKYYFIPLILGILGLIFHFRKDRQSFWVAFLLFLFTGPAIVVYLNEVPITPRERDYVHVGSFMVFAIWIGLGAYAVLSMLRKYSTNRFLYWSLSLALILAVPGLLFTENLDDHDRSGRTAARDFAKNMLSSCEQDAILFTSADNDTYPIWYLQQVENFRPDIRQVLTSFLPMDWYGNQMNHSYEGCGNVQISFKDEELLQKTNQYFPIMRQIDSSIEVKEVVQFIKSHDKRTKIQREDGASFNYIPGKQLSISVNKSNFISQSNYLQIKESELPSQIEFTVNKQYLTRDELLVLDMLVNNDWKRPVYTMYPNLFRELGLFEYLHREGIVYRLLPYKNTEVLHNQKAFALNQYELINKEFKWGNINDEEVYIDHTTRQMTETFRLRQAIADIAADLIRVGEYGKAIEILDLEQIQFSPDKFQNSYFSAQLARCYYDAGAKEKGNEMVSRIYKRSSQNLNYYLMGKTLNKSQLSFEAQLELYLIQELINICKDNNPALQKELMAGFDKYF